MVACGGIMEPNSLSIKTIQPLGLREGSMYTFNRIDQRLQRLMEASIFIFESFAGFEHKYEQLGCPRVN